MSSIVTLALFIVVCFATGAIGGIWTSQSLPDWYQNLNKPALNPPGWVFGPVWSVLYIFMAVAAWLVFKRVGFGYELSFWSVQLALNLLWSYLFFGLHNPRSSFFELVVLWVMILATLVSFRAVNSITVYLLTPYLLWVTFAGYLNYQLWRLNSP